MQMSMVTNYLWHICINFSSGHYEYKAIKKKLMVSLSIWDLASYFHISLYEKEKSLLMTELSGVSEGL